MLAAALIWCAAAPSPALATPEQAALAEANREKLFQGTGLSREQQDRVIANLSSLRVGPPWREEQIELLFHGVFDSGAVWDVLALTPVGAAVNAYSSYRQAQIKSTVVTRFEALWQVYRSEMSRWVGPSGSKAVLPLEFKELLERLLELSNWFLGIASFAYAAVAMYRGFALAFPDGSGRRAEGQQALLNLAIGGCLVFGCWLIVSVLKAVVEQYR
ncbi:MAG: pilin [Moorellales bacterium]